MRHLRFPRAFSVAVVSVLLLAGCTSKSTPAESSSTETSIETSIETSVVPEGTTVKGATGLVAPDDAVAIDYFVAKDNPPLLKETLVDMKKPTKSVSMLVDKITYAGVVCGFSFTGKDRPVSPVSFRFQIENADLTIVDESIEVKWVGDEQEVSAGGGSGWNFTGDAQVNRNGPGWVVQVGAIPIGGGKGKAAPKRALCTLTSGTEMPVTVGPIAYWAGFATV